MNLFFSIPSHSQLVISLSMPSPRERRTTPLVIDVDGLQLSTSIDAESGTHCPPSVSRQPQTIWKYNAINHLLISHSDEDPTQTGKYQVPAIPGDLMMDMFMTRQEEQWMNISPSATTTFRRENNIPSSDGLENYVIQDEERQKRDRSNTLTIPEPAEKRRRTRNAVTR